MSARAHCQAATLCGSNDRADMQRERERKRERERQTDRQRERERGERERKLRINKAFPKHKKTVLLKYLKI